MFASNTYYTIAMSWFWNRPGGTGSGDLGGAGTPGNAENNDPKVLSNFCIFLCELCELCDLL